ncbi:MAG: hypothetical protein A3F70_05225 [Acidobacteria bacterium RIFCSPLOWO2_12_FULL_67_14]|nr:MAG: hypothetical protein A3F70_05225 [Acidobacteria bacterium RIFCSPLOWO2_12_FULL_67_14]
MANQVFATVGRAVLAALLVGPAFLMAQAPAKPSPAKPWTMPRTPDGKPDLQGYWTSLSFTPLERPEKYGTREFLTDEEVKAIFEAGVNRYYEFTFANSADTPVYDATVYALDAWQNGVRPNRRTSLIVDPPNGRLPALTPEGKARPRRRGQGEDGFDGPEKLGTGVRCLTNGGPPIPAGSGYNNNTFILQGPGQVVIEYEWMSKTRVIPTDGRPHLAPHMRFWTGNGVGRWDGDTLVVENRGFQPEATYMDGNPATLRIIERFTRIDADTIEYKYTVDDPSTWTRPWTAITPLSKVDGPLFEYACHEGNNGIVNMLEGARAQDKAGAARPESR